MKKTLAMLLVFVMLLSLCACNSSDNQTTDPSDSSQSTTDGTENTTGNTEAPTDGTEGTQAPTDEPTTPPTQAPTETPTTPPTEAPTTPPTETPTTPPATQPTACSHNWKDATCSTPKTCAKCGATEGSASSHNWKDATCTAPKTCSKCGATEGSASGHNWKDATCTAPKTCSKCNATEGNTVGHSLTAACTMCGKTNTEYVGFADGWWDTTELKNDGFVISTYYIWVADREYYDQETESSYFETVIELHAEYDIYLLYTTWAENAKNQGRDVEKLTAEYEAFGMILTINGTKYVLGEISSDRWDVDYTEENGVLTMNLDNGETLVLTRTGFAEYTVTGGNFLEAGIKLTA